MSNLLINEIEAELSLGEMVELSKETQESTIGGQNCTYAGLGYSPGSVVSMPGGNKTCQSDGTWF